MSEVMNTSNRDPDTNWRPYDISLIADFFMREKAIRFITESNLIEGIDRDPTQVEIECHIDFLRKPTIRVLDLEQFVNVYQPGALLREEVGRDVRVGNHIPPPGGISIFYALEDLLVGIDDLTPYEAHCRYETLHPFTDGNGRSGRMLWAWHMTKRGANVPSEFLRLFYYQALDEGRK